jgi:ABC-type Fe3+/spermidine/putrescine transport system ATPase subunit
MENEIEWFRSRWQAKLFSRDMARPGREAMTMGARVAVLRNGKLQQLASPSELYDRPANAFVAGFMGTPTMNTC